MYIYVCVYIYIFIYFLTMQSGQSPILNKPLSSVEKTCHFPVLMANSCCHMSETDTTL